MPMIPGTVGDVVELALQEPSRFNLRIALQRISDEIANHPLKAHTTKVEGLRKVFNRLVEIYCKAYKQEPTTNG